jgi:hypothetical protein
MMLRLVPALTVLAMLATACTRSEMAPQPAKPQDQKAAASEHKDESKAFEPARYDPNLKPGKVTWDPERKKMLEARGFSFDANGNPIPPKQR